MSRNSVFPAPPLEDGGNYLATTADEARRPSSVTASTSRQPISKPAGDDNKSQREASYRGVRRLLREELWVAHVTLRDGKRTRLGYYSSPIEAAKAYDRAIVQALGPRVSKAMLNFPAETPLVHFPETVKSRSSNTQFHGSQHAMPKTTASQHQREAAPEGVERSGSDIHVPRSGTRYPSAQGNPDALSQREEVQPAGTDVISSKFRGVKFFKPTGRWQASLRDNEGRSISLGSYVSEMQAARAHDRAAIRLYGECAKTNFVRAEYPQELKAWLDKEKGASAQNPGEEQYATYKTSLGVIVQQSVLADAKTASNITVQAQENTTSRQPASSGQRFDSNNEETSGTGASRRKGQNPTHCKRKATEFDLDKQQKQSSRDYGGGHPASRIIDKLDGAQGQLITGSSKASNTAEKSADGPYQPLLPFRNHSPEGIIPVEVMPRRRNPG